MQLPNAYAQHKGGTRALRDANWMSIDLTLDLLGGCEHKCPGCFVNKKLPFLGDDLDVTCDLVRQWRDAGYDFNELFLGPTDIFSASNLDDVVTDPKFQEMSQYFTFTCTSTCLNDYDETARRIQLLEDTCDNWRGRNFEIFVVLDIPKYLADDEEYLTVFNKNLELLYNDNVFLLLNVYSEDMFNDMSLFDLNAKVKADYNTKVRVNPSYFRGTSRKHVERYAQLHRRMLEREVTDDTIQGIFLNMIDIYFGGYTFGNYAFVNHNLFISPLIYEAIPVDNDELKIPRNAIGMYDLADLERKQVELFERQYEYSHKTAECSSCKYLASCAARNVLTYMETREITECFLPKTLFRDASRVIELEKRNAG